MRRGKEMLIVIGAVMFGACVGLLACVMLAAASRDDERDGQ